MEQVLEWSRIILPKELGQASTLIQIGLPLEQVLQEHQITRHLRSNRH